MTTNEMKKVMDNGKKVKCPLCEKGYWTKKSKYIYSCDSCDRRIIERAPIHLNF